MTSLAIPVTVRTTFQCGVATMDLENDAAAAARVLDCTSGMRHGMPIVARLSFLRLWILPGQDDTLAASSMDGAVGVLRASELKRLVNGERPERAGLESRR